MPKGQKFIIEIKITFSVFVLTPNLLMTEWKFFLSAENLINYLYTYINKNEDKCFDVLMFGCYSVEAFSQENNDLKKKVDSLENNNRSLLGQLQKLQALVGKVSRHGGATTQTGTVLMVGTPLAPLK